MTAGGMRPGLLLIAHGSRDEAWVRLVDAALDRLRAAFPGVPATAGYLELVDGRLIPDGVRELERQGVTDIVAVPLFVSSGSTHLDEIAWALGLKDEPELETDLTRVDTACRVHLCPPMDDHPLIAAIVVERARALAKDPAREALVLVGHGSEHPGFRERWEALLDRLTQHVGQAVGFGMATYATFHPDTLRVRVAEAAEGHRVVVVPLFLSAGYFTRTVIPQKLSGLPYAYSGETYLPHENVYRWLEETARQGLAKAAAPSLRG